MNVSLEQDPDLIALQADQRKKRRVPIGIFVAVLAVVGLYPVMGLWSVRSNLAGEGYRDVDVSLNGYFTYGFTGKKGGMECSGTIVRSPVHTSKNEGCFGSSGLELSSR